MRSVARVVLTYAAVAAAWIVVSDWLLDIIGLQAFGTQVAKGLLFVVVTSVVLWSALAREDKRRTQAEATLRSVNRRLSALVETSPMAVIMLDTSGRVELWNPAAARIFGWNEAEVLGKPNPIVPDGDSTFPQLFRKALDGEAVEGARVRRLDSRGREIDVLLYTASTRDDDGNTSGVVGLLSDVSDQVEAERELERYKKHLEELVRERTEELSTANERLRQATEIKSAFLANMSHELRTPLNSIIGFSGAMLQGLAGELSDEQSKQLGMVYRSGKHLLDLINDILDISKIEAGRVGVDVSEFDLGAMAETVVASLEPEAAAKGLRVSVDLTGNARPVVSDKTKMRQILTNLVGNAIKFTELGAVDLRVHTSADLATVEVQDTGPGVPAEERVRIFDEFTQSQRRADGKPEGTGLGLAISRRLARMLGGDIEVESVVGEGSVFSVRIPRVFADRKPSVSAGENGQE